MTIDPRDAEHESLLKAYLASQSEPDFEAMLRGVGGRVKRLIRSKLQKNLRNFEDELFTDTMLAIRDGADSFRGESSPLAWIAGIVRIQVFAVIRKEKRNVLRKAEELVGKFVEKASLWLGTWTGVPQADESSEEPRKPDQEAWRLKLEAVLEALPDDCQMLLALRCDDKLTIDEIALKIHRGELLIRLRAHQKERYARKTLKELVRRVRNRVRRCVVTVKELVERKT